MAIYSRMGNEIEIIKTHRNEDNILIITASRKVDGKTIKYTMADIVCDNGPREFFDTIEKLKS